jgi:hypothetical protein
MCEREPPDDPDAIRKRRTTGVGAPFAFDRPMSQTATGRENRWAAARERLLVDHPLRQGRVLRAQRAGTPRGSRESLKRNSDGSVDVYVQADRPGKDHEPNWLPAPKDGPFNLLLRMYWPKQPVLDGAYEPPPVRAPSPR